MPTGETSRRVDSRLQELYDRYLPEEEGSVDRYYESGRGYYRATEAGEERDHFGVSLVAADGDLYETGDCDRPFPMQSISKVFVYALALEDHGREEVLRHVGVEPSGDAYNSIVFDEHNHRPHNPMVNAGALVTSDLVRGKDEEEKLDRILDSLRTFAHNPDLAVDEDVFEREWQTADRNRATAYLMRSQGMLEGDVEAILALYLKQCSIKVTSHDLAIMAATLANGCTNPIDGERAAARGRVRDVLSVMYTCGMYDAAGQWAYEVGFPAKSGVSGGIMAAIPGKLGAAVYSPGLDHYGNSARGIRVCEEISARLGLHVFASEDEDAILGAAARAGD